MLYFASQFSLNKLGDKIKLHSLKYSYNSYLAHLKLLKHDRRFLFLVCFNTKQTKKRHHHKYKVNIKYDYVPFSEILRKRKNNFTFLL